MPKLIKEFRYSPDGVKIIDYQPGEEIDGRAADIAYRLGLLEKKADSPSRNKALQPSSGK